MRGLLRSIALAGFGLALGAGAAFAAPLKVGFAAEPYPPFTEQTASGEWKGFEVDLAAALCKAMQVECVQVGIAWDGIIPALTSGKIDMIMSSMSITDERRKTIAFSDRYYYTPSVFVANKDSNIEVSVDGLRGKIIGVQSSTTNADYVQKTYGASGDTQIKYYNTQDEVNADLAAGRIDLMLADQLAMAALLKTDQGKNMEIIANAPPDPAFGEGIGVGLRKEDKDLLAKVNAGIKELLESGEYDQIARNYFDFDIYGARD
jgi:polar amino acid transport system substrate-binding protein